MFCKNSSTIFFLFSIKFRLNYFTKIIKYITTFTVKLFSSKEKREERSIGFKTEINSEKKINETIENEIIQPNLPFKNIEKNSSKKKFKLPPIDYLKKPVKKDSKLQGSDNKNNNSEFLEKILLDFGVEGKIKKISQGPVVTLNEF